LDAIKDWGLNVIKKLEKSVSKAYEVLSWSSIEKCLSEVMLTSDDADKVLRITKISEHLINKRPDRERELRRDDLLNRLSGLFAERGYVEHAVAVSRHADLLRRIESYYHSILSALDELGLNTSTGQARISALLHRSARQYLDLLEDAKEYLSSSDAEEYLASGVSNITTRSGKEVNPAAVHGALVEAIVSTLSLEAHRCGWFDEAGLLVIPDIPPVDEVAQNEIEAVQMLAIYWRNVERAERRARYMDAELYELVDDLPKDWVSRGINKIVRLTSRTSLERFDFIANCRLEKRFEEHLVAVTTGPIYKKHLLGLEASGNQPVGSPLSVWELHGITALSRLAFRDVVNDPEEFAGLRLAEWVRGYTVLRMLSEEMRSTKVASNLLMTLSKEDLAAVLIKHGLPMKKSYQFIDLVTFGKKSRDAFDCPLVRLASGEYLLLGLVACDTLIPRAVLSSLGSRGVSIKGKGLNFEAHIIGLLKSQGFDAVNIKRKRLGEEYDYDVVFEWGDYIFLIECKCIGLSNNEPVGAYYFDLEMQSAVSQVKRLKRGLDQHPDMLSEFFPRAAERKVVFVILNSLPYAVPGGTDGILIADESSFARFFTNPKVGGRRIDPDNGFQEISEEDCIASTWTGDLPTPEDLCQHLKQPFQVLNADAHTKISAAVARIGHGTIGVFEEFGQVNMTVDSIRRGLREAGYFGISH
jgi:hypothetical protein